MNDFPWLEADKLVILRFLLNRTVHKALLTGLNSCVIRINALSIVLVIYSFRTCLLGDASYNTLLIDLFIIRELSGRRARLQHPALLEEMELGSLLERILIGGVIQLVRVGSFEVSVVARLLPRPHLLHPRIALNLVHGLINIETGNYKSQNHH